MELSLAFKHFEKGKQKVSKGVQELIDKKSKKIEEMLPKHAAKSARLELVLDEIDKRALGYKFKLEAKLKLPEKNLFAKHRSKTLEEAIEAVEKKILVQLRKYKTQHTDRTMDKKKLAKLRRVLRRG